MGEFDSPLVDCISSNVIVGANMKLDLLELHEKYETIAELEEILSERNAQLLYSVSKGVWYIVDNENIGRSMAIFSLSKLAESSEGIEDVLNALDACRGLGSIG